MGHYSERKLAEQIRIVVRLVEACHSLGVMHWDLKPDNFLDNDLLLEVMILVYLVSRAR